MKTKLFLSAVLLGSLATAIPATAGTVFFSTGDPDGRMAAASRPTAGAPFEIESADDFVLTNHTTISSATFTGLLPSDSPLSDVGNVTVEIYRIFPLDSNVARTSGPPKFSTPQVPTRVNSPSDVALDSRSSSSGLTFSTTALGTFTASNSVQPGGIHPFPSQTTGGDGSVTGQEVEFNVTFTTPLDLLAGHYFFVPQVEVNGGGNFEWLSAERPIVSPGTPFPPGFTDLQGWTRDDSTPGIDPDWLRIGSDIVGGTPAPTFNFAFSITGDAVPEPSTWAVMLVGIGLVGVWFRQRRGALVV